MAVGHAFTEVVPRLDLNINPGPPQLAVYRKVRGDFLVRRIERLFVNKDLLSIRNSNKRPNRQYTHCQSASERFHGSFSLRLIWPEWPAVPPTVLSSTPDASKSISRATHSSDSSRGVSQVS